MRFPLLPLLCVVSLAAAGCALIQGGQTAKLLDPFIKHPVAEVADRIGPPTANYDMGQGFMAFEWAHFAPGQTGQPSSADCLVVIAALPTYGDTRSTPPNDLSNWIVQSFHAYGRGCPTPGRKVPKT